jgi:hypothetical protein
MFINVYPCLSMFILVYLSHQNRIMLPPQKYAEVSWVSSKFLSATNSRASVDCHSAWAIPQDTHGTHVCLTVYSRRNPSNISNSMSFRRVIPVTWLWPGNDLAMTWLWPATARPESSVAPSAKWRCFDAFLLGWCSPGTYSAYIVHKSGACFPVPLSLNMQMLECFC